MARAVPLAAALGVLFMAGGCATASVRPQRVVSTEVSVPSTTSASAQGTADSSSRPVSAARVRSTAHRPRWASGAGAPAFPVPADVHQRSIDAVALAGAVAMASADTAVDRDDPEHTAVRAAWAGWLTPAYAHRVLTARIVGPPGTEWDTWCRHRAYVVVTASPSGEDHPPDTATVAARKVVLHERVVGRDGWRAAMPSVVVAVVVRKLHEVWRIDSDQPG